MQKTLKSQRTSYSLCYGTPICMLIWRLSRGTNIYFGVFFKFFKMFFKAEQTNKMKMICLQRTKGFWVLNPRIRRSWKGLTSFQGQTEKNNAKIRQIDSHWENKVWCPTACTSSFPFGRGRRKEEQLFSEWLSGACLLAKIKQQHRDNGFHYNFIFHKQNILVYIQGSDGLAPTYWINHFSMW